MSNEIVRVLIVDDSAVMCRFIDKALQRDSTLEVVGHAHDPFEARDMIKRLNPDVLTLDVNMPRMDGLTFLENLMRLRPIPTVMLSSQTAARSAIALEALERGAVDVMLKRHPEDAADLERYADEIARRVGQAGRGCSSASADEAGGTVPHDLADCRRKLLAGRALGGGVDRIIGLGASTGGPDALRQVLRVLEAPDCALVVCQHMPESFLPRFVTQLDSHSSFDIRLAQDGEVLRPGRGYVAPGGCHLSLDIAGARARWRLEDLAPVHGHRPAIDTLFGSIAEHAPEQAALVLLSGMGEDGAAALLKARRRGSLTLVQDEQSSVVWGMPGSAWRMGGGDVMLGLSEIGPALNALLERPGGSGT